MPSYEVRHLVQGLHAFVKLRQEQGEVVRHPGVDRERNGDAVRRSLSCKILVFRQEKLIAETRGSVSASSGA